MQVKSIVESHIVPLYLLWNGQGFKGRATPILDSYKDGVYLEHYVGLNGEHLGKIVSTGYGWKLDNTRVAQGLVDAIGNYLVMWYE